MVRGGRKRVGVWAHRLLEDTGPGAASSSGRPASRCSGKRKGTTPPLSPRSTFWPDPVLPLDEAFARGLTVGRLVVSEVSKNLIHVFFLMEGAKKAAPPSNRDRWNAWASSAPA